MTADFFQAVLHCANRYAQDKHCPPRMQSATVQTAIIHLLHSEARSDEALGECQERLRGLDERLDRLLSLRDALRKRDGYNPTFVVVPKKSKHRRASTKWTPPPEQLMREQEKRSA